MLVSYNQTDSVAFPKNLVEYVLPYAPLLPSSYQHDALIGSLIYKNDKLPIIDLARIDNPKNHMVLPRITDGKYRIIILSSIHPDSFCDNYAVISNSPPRLADVSAEMLSDVDEVISPLFYSKVKLGSKNTNQFTYIPYLEKIEETLFTD